MVFAFVLLLFLVTAPSAHAAVARTVLESGAYDEETDELTVEGTFMVEIEGEGAEADDLRVRVESGGVRIRSVSGPMRVGRGCRKSADGAFCRVDLRELRGQGVELLDGEEIGVTVFGDAGDDRLTLERSGRIPVSLAGGDGADELRGGPGPAALGGGAGVDRLLGQGGADELFGEGDGDLISGGAGRDVITYRGFSTPVIGPVTVDLLTGEGTTGGVPDRLLGIEDVEGSQVADVLRGDDGPNRIEGGAQGGGDRLEGRGGDDRLIGTEAIYDGGAGDDRLAVTPIAAGQDDASKYVCGPGVDLVLPPLDAGRFVPRFDCERVEVLTVTIGPRLRRRGREGLGVVVTRSSRRYPLILTARRGGSAVVVGRADPPNRSGSAPPVVVPVELTATGRRLVRGGGALRLEVSVRVAKGLRVVATVPSRAGAATRSPRGAPSPPDP